MPRSIPAFAGQMIFIFILFVLAACESRQRTGLEWKEVVLKNEGVSIHCPVDFNSTLPETAGNGRSIICSSAEADYHLSVEPWNRFDNEDENRKSAFDAIKSAVSPAGETISTDIVWRSDLLVLESVRIQDANFRGEGLMGKTVSPAARSVWFERAFLIKKKLYKMSVSYAIPDRDSYAVVLNNMREDREKFFASFHIIPEI